MAPALLIALQATFADTTMITRLVERTGLPLLLNSSMFHTWRNQLTTVDTMCVVVS